MSKEIRWGSDTPISMPVPHQDLTDVVSVPLDGLAFTPMGLTFDLTQTDLEEHYLSQYGPGDGDG